VKTFIEQITHAQQVHNSLLCVGLDPDPAQFPLIWRGDRTRIYEFCRSIVDATHDLVIAFKPQIAYFAANRAEDQLEDLIAYIHERAPQVPVVLDAKRGDIGSTAEQYAREAFERYQADALTLSPFMGWDSIAPYLAYPDKGLFLLCRTSNAGAADFQAQVLSKSGQTLFEAIAQRASQGDWNHTGQMGLVVGATAPLEIEQVRTQAPTLPLLIPGVGAQGGDAQATVRAGLRESSSNGAAAITGPILVNSSRAILYASAGDDFAHAARQVALQTRDVLNQARCRAQDSRKAFPARCINEVRTHGDHNELGGALRKS
jgi:orotidine-5'-phosphate decarboxylase